MRLHLGCGQRYFDGYINIDYPLTEHSVQKTSVADEFANLFELNYVSNSINEIRLHHVFEHFSRAQACAMLTSWNSWLVKDGVLHIEVPDFYRTARAALNPFTSMSKKFVALRHIFGSQEAHWAVHYEGYSKYLLVSMLELFGFEIKDFRYNNWLGTYNIEVIAIKKIEMSKAQAHEAAQIYLSHYLVSKVESENILLKTWIEAYEQHVEMTFSRNK
jgi:predicted SAM-dependent methyltransferase